MSAWKQNAPDERWFHVTIPPSTVWAQLRQIAANRHGLSVRAGTLSIFRNIANTEAIVKIADAGNWTPNSTYIITIYSPDTLPTLQAMVASTLWRST